MPHSRLEDLPSASTRWPGVSGDNYRTQQWGDMEVALTVLHGTLDCTENYKFGGLPGGVCPCPHYGYVFEGNMRAIYPDTDWPDEFIQAGEAFFIPAGHVLKYEDPNGCRVLELNPAHALQMCMDAMQRAIDKRAAAAVESAE